MRPPESEDDQRAYGGLRRAILTPAPVGPLAPVTGSDAQIAAGLAVYRNNVRAAYLRALADTVPVVQRLVGAEFFRYLAHEYFYAFPAPGPLAARYGDRLPDFLRGFAPAAHLPYLADVARLEIAWLAAYHAADAVSLTAEQVFAAIGEDAEHARFSLHPSMQLISSAYPVHTIWRHNKREDTAPLTLGDAGERVLIIRPAETVDTSTPSRGLYVALRALAAGSTFGEAIDVALDAAPSEALSDIVQGIATSGAISALSTQPTLKEGL